MRRIIYLLIVFLFIAAILMLPYMGKRGSDNVQYTEIPKNGLPTFLEFYSVSCEICRMMKPGIHKLQEEFKGKMNFLLVDVDAESSKKLAAKFDVYTLPSIHIFDAEGTLLQSFEGLVGIKTLRTELGNVIRENTAGEKKDLRGRIYDPQ